MKTLVTFYAVADTQEQASAALLWDSQDEAEQYNAEEFNGESKVFQLDVELDWSLAKVISD